jgi:predicted small lipoprotein YifL
VRRRACAAALIALLLLTGAGCGRKGPPLPPLRPISGPISDLTAARTDDRVTLTFTIPRTNRDGSTPSAVQHIEIYMMETAPGAAVPSVMEILAADHLLTSIDVRPRDAVAAKGDPPDRRPIPGEKHQFVDVVTGRTPGAPDAPTRHYLAIGVVSKRKGDPSPVVSVPLSRTPDVLHAGEGG